ncbi:MAG TPA: hypothetical protein VG125_21465, partial [Pirellulales bacterium]|nr:hypothetical protein [Pirellulales bacterium]
MAVDRCGLAADDRSPGIVDVNVVTAEPAVQRQGHLRDQAVTVAADQLLLANELIAVFLKVDETEVGSLR